MVQWRTKLHPSRQTQQWAYGLYILLLLALLGAPWPLSRWLVGPVLLVVVVFDARHVQRRIAAAQGEIVLLSDTVLGWQVNWQGNVWCLVTRPIITPWGAWLQIRYSNQWQRLWLAADSMPSTAWRSLCRVLKQYAISTIKAAK